MSVLKGWSGEENKAEVMFTTTGHTLLQYDVEINLQLGWLNFLNVVLFTPTLKGEEEVG